MTNTLVLRNAVAEDEAFVLHLEETCLRKLAAAGHGRFVPRPGAGDEFPANCRIIQYESRDVGCVMVSSAEDWTHIDQLYLIPDCRGNAIEELVASHFVAQAVSLKRRVIVTLPKHSDQTGFFAEIGFRTVSAASKTVTMEFITHSKRVTCGIKHVQKNSDREPR